MLIKWIGSGLIIAGSTGLGFLLAGQWKTHLRTLETLKRLILLLRGEILYANAPLSEAFDRVGRKDEGEMGLFFREVSIRIEDQQGEPFFQIWKEETDKLGKDTCLSKEDKLELKNFGEHLGYLDRTMQESTIGMYVERLDFTIQYLREHEREKSRLYTSLGIMGGLFLTIVLS